MELEDKASLLIILLFVLVMFIVSLNYKEINTELAPDALCEQEENLTYSYFNKTTKEVTTNDSKIPIYTNCKDK